MGDKREGREGETSRFSQQQFEFTDWSGDEHKHDVESEESFETPEFLLCSCEDKLDLFFFSLGECDFTDGNSHDLSFISGLVPGVCMLFIPSINPGQTELDEGLPGVDGFEIIILTVAGDEGKKSRWLRRVSDGFLECNLFCDDSTGVVTNVLIGFSKGLGGRTLPEEDAGNSITKELTVLVLCKGAGIDVSV
jgi:hypothetical protein